MMANVDHRVLAGFQCVDAVTKQSIVAPLKVSSPQLVLRVNRSGVYSVWDAPNLRAETAFDPPTPWPNPETPAPEVAIEDPSMRYLPRRTSIQLPQPLPVAPAAPAPPFTATSSQAIAYGPQLITLYCGPSAPVDPNWAVVRVSVANNANPPVPLRWAVLQVLNGKTVMATGVADSRGEALLAIQGLGLQVSQTAGGPVTEATTAATVQAWFDATILKQPANWVPNPDDQLQQIAGGTLKTASASINIGPGQTVVVPLTVSM